MASTRVITLVVASALFMENLDGTVIATSLPAIATDLGVDPIILKLAFTAYLVALAIFIPVSGWCADRFGARNVFRVALGLFIASSIGCAMADSLGWLVAARFVQGMGGAMMVPVGRLILLRIVSKAELLTAMAWFSIPALVAPVMGPPIGGFITTYYDWRWIFWINVPIGLVGMVVASFVIPRIRAPQVPPLDVVGFLLCGTGLSTLIFGFTLLGREVLPDWAAIAMVAGGAAAVAFYVRHARRTDHPVVDLSLLRVPTFHSAVVGGFLFRVGIGAIPFLLPLMLQLGFGLTPFASGLLTFAAAAGALTMKFTARPILSRFGFRRALVANTLISAGLLGVVALFTAETPHLVIIGVLLAGGFFRSLQFTALNALAYADVEPDRLSRATSFAAAAQQVALSTGVAVAALVLEAAQSIRGDAELVTADFAIGFVVVALLSAIPALLFRRMAHDAGAEVSGHRLPTTTKAAD